MESRWAFYILQHCLPELIRFWLKGLPNNPRLGTSKPPTKTDVTNLRRYKLAKLATPEEPLDVNTAWDTHRCDRFFRTLFPELWDHLDRHPPKADQATSEDVQQQKWLSVVKEKQSVSLDPEPLPNGALLAHNAKVKGHGAAERVLYIGAYFLISFLLLLTPCYSSYQDQSLP